MSKGRTHIGRLVVVGSFSARWLLIGCAVLALVVACGKAAPGTGAAETEPGPSAEEPDSPTVTLSASPNPVDEGDSVTVTANLSAALADAVEIPVTVTADTPDTAEDGDHGTLESITIDAGATSGTGTITTAQDADTEDETFTVALGKIPSTVTAGSPNHVTVTINDDDSSTTGGEPDNEPDDEPDDEPDEDEPDDEDEGETEDEPDNESPQQEPPQAEQGYPRVCYVCHEETMFQGTKACETCGCEVDWRKPPPNNSADGCGDP